MIVQHKFNDNSQNKIKKPDIYDGTELIRFNSRHPIFKALMKLEFEGVIRQYHKRINDKKNKF